MKAIELIARLQDIEHSAPDMDVKMVTPSDYGGVHVEDIYDVDIEGNRKSTEEEVEYYIAILAGGV